MSLRQAASPPRERRATLQLCDATGYENTEKTIAQIARDLGVPERVLYSWRHQFREQQQAFPGKGHQTELEETNRRLTRELETLRQEREVLREVVAIFSSPLTHGPA